MNHVQCRPLSTKRQSRLLSVKRIIDQMRFFAWAQSSDAVPTRYTKENPNAETAEDYHQAARN